MKYQIIILLIFTNTLIFSQNTPDGFEWNSSMNQAFYFFNSVTLNQIEIESDDWVAAFNGDVCVGSKQWNTSNCGNQICEVPVMGFDSSIPSQTNGYCQLGDIPTFKIYN